MADALTPSELGRRRGFGSPPSPEVLALLPRSAGGTVAFDADAEAERGQRVLEAVRAASGEPLQPEQCRIRGGSVEVIDADPERRPRRPLGKTADGRYVYEDAERDSLPDGRPKPRAKYVVRPLGGVWLRVEREHGLAPMRTYKCSSARQRGSTRQARGRGVARIRRARSGSRGSPRRSEPEPPPRPPRPKAAA